MGLGMESGNFIHKLTNINTLIYFALCLCHLSHSYQSHPNINQAWDKHKQTYGLGFNSTEDRERKIIFERNFQYIERINAANLSYTLEMNHFGHLYPEELVTGFNGKNIGKLMVNKNGYRAKHKMSIVGVEAKEIDWRKVDAVSPVKNQGSCGSCWSFSATGAMESHYRLKHGYMKYFSEQQLIDCDTSMLDHGCSGGFPVSAFEYAREVGLVTENEYIYEASDDICQLKVLLNKHHNVTKINGYTVLDSSEQSLTSALYKYGPISVAIDASGAGFQFYKQGVYENPHCKNNVESLNHAVLAVGYGHDEFTKKDYYIVKNSWSTNWGDKGYIKMVRNSKNNCGISTFASFPIF